jgi:uncharacterized protein (TIGR02246 family)
MVVAAACSTKTETAATRDTAATGTAAGAVATDAGAVRRAIDEANARFVAAMKRGDTTAMAANYSDDAVIMMPNEAAWHGRDAVRKGFGRFLSQMPVKDMKANTEDVMVSGDLAVETGSYEMTAQPKGGKEVTDKGKYITVWKRQPDGSWRIVRDINNSDLSPKM